MRLVVFCAGAGEKYLMCCCQCESPRFSDSFGLRSRRIIFVPRFLNLLTR
uniref:Uncharacterized protein n=1 Tax=Arundo donax TaxID=35708 RepID=A0A0A9ER29_ARUDO